MPVYSIRRPPGPRIPARQTRQLLGKHLVSTYVSNAPRTYLVLRDGVRVDSFLTLSAARRCVQRLIEKDHKCPATLAPVS